MKIAGATDLVSEAISRCLSTQDGQVLLAFILQETKYQIPVDTPDIPVQQFGIKLAGKLGVYGTDEDGSWPIEFVRFGLWRSGVGRRE